MAASSNTIIITRPEPYAEQLEALLLPHDFEVATHPLIEFVTNDELPHDDSIAATKNADLIIFISQQAVRFALQDFSSEQLAVLNEKTVISVGKATQEALAEFNIQAQRPERSDSEGILELVSQIIEQDDSLSVLLVCGNDGRELLQEQLSKQHQVQRLETYRRVGLAQTFPKFEANKHYAIIVTSEQLLELSLHQISLQQTPEMQTSDKSLLQSLVFICASSRIEAKAKSLGVSHCIVAKSAANQDLVNACLEWQANQTHNNLLQSDTMSESDQHENEIIEALELDQEDNNDNRATKKKGGFFKPLFWLLILAGLGYGGYWLWNQGYLSINSENSANADANTQLNRLVTAEKQLQQQAKQIAELIAANNAQQTHNESAEQELNRQVESLQQQLIASQRKFQSLSADAATQARDWQIAEAEYLIRQAAQKIHYSDDAASIIALLEAADQQVLASGDTNLLALRRAISQDITQIKSNVAIDIEGILVKLDAIQSQLSKLTLASVKLASADNTEVQEEANLDVTAWQIFKSNMKNTFSDYYKVHHYDQSVKPFINPQQADLLQQNLLLSIKTAQLSALRQQQQSYQTSISELTNWINEFYQKDQAATVLLNQLELLAQAQVSVTLPNKLTSLDFIKSNNQERLNQWLQSPTLESQKIEDNNDEDEEAGTSGDIDSTIKNALERMDTNSDEQTPADDEGDQE